MKKKPDYKTILKILVAFLLLTGIASASYWVGDKEIGLTQYQSSGYVDNIYIERPIGSDTSLIYFIPKWMNTARESTRSFSCTEHYLNNGHSYLYCIPSGWLI